jgi:hypothetical protein
MATNAGTTSHSMNSSHPTTSQSQPGTSSLQREASPSPSSSSPKCEEVKVVFTANEQRASNEYQYMSSMFVTLNWTSFDWSLIEAFEYLKLIKLVTFCFESLRLKAWTIS